MEVSKIFPMFADPTLPTSCAQLGFEMVKINGDLGREDVKTVIKYLDEKLKKCKSNEPEPLLMINSLLKNCSANVMVENCLNWVEKLVKFVQVNANEKIICLSYEAITNIFPYVTQNSEINRQFCSSHLGSLVGILLNNNQKVNNQKVSICKLRCLNYLMKTFRNPCRQYHGAIEKFLTTMLAENSNVLLQQEAARCLPIASTLPSESTAGWSSCFKKLLRSLYEILEILFEDVESDYIWQPDFEGNFTFPPLSKSQPTLNYHILQKRFHLLCFSISEMMSVNCQIEIQLPLNEVVGFITRVLVVTPLSMKRVTSDEQILAAILPLFHGDALRVLSSLIKTCGTLLLPEAQRMCRLFLSELKWTDVSQAQYNKNTPKPFSGLRCQIYSTLKLWMETMSSGNGFKKNSIDLYKYFKTDMKNPEFKIQLETVSEEMKSRKRKRGQGFIGIGTVGPVKDNSLINSNLCLACLKALKSVHYVMGETIHPATYNEISTMAIHLACSNQNSASRPSPYDAPECRLALYELILALTLKTPYETGSCLQPAIQIFSRAKNDPFLKISTFCLQAHTICQQLIHPRQPSLKYLIDREIIKTGRNEIVEKTDKIIENNVEAEVQTINSPDSLPDIVLVRDEEKYKQIELINPIATEDLNVTDQIVKEVEENGGCKNKENKMYESDASRGDINIIGDSDSSINPIATEDLNVTDQIVCVCVCKMEVEENGEEKNEKNKMDESDTSGGDSPALPPHTHTLNNGEDKGRDEDNGCGGVQMISAPPNDKTELDDKETSILEEDADSPPIELTLSPANSEVSLNVQEMLKDFVPEPPEQPASIL